MNSFSSLLSSSEFFLSSSSILPCSSNTFSKVTCWPISASSYLLRPQSFTKTYRRSWITWSSVWTRYACLILFSSSKSLYSAITSLLDRSIEKYSEGIEPSVIPNRRSVSEWKGVCGNKSLLRAWLVLKLRVSVLQAIFRKDCDVARIVFSGSWALACFTCFVVSKSCLLR